MKQKKNKELTITDPEMSRFSITIDEGVNMVLYALSNLWGGEIFVPKIPSYKLLDLAEAVCSESVKKIVGLRPGEKIHEEMITSSDSYNTYDIGKYFVILPQAQKLNTVDFVDFFGARKVSDGFSYNSGSNSEWLDMAQLKLLLSRYFMISNEN